VRGKKPNPKIGSLIKVARKSQGISQMQLASRLGISYQQLQKYEYGASHITVSRLTQIANALGLPVKSFIDAQPGVAESDSLINEKELKLLMLFRGLGREELRDVFLNTLENISKVSK